VPHRYIREGILTSKKVSQLSWPAEVFYRRLMSVVDDFGRYYATPMMLRAAAYPLQLDKVSDLDVGKWLGETQKAGLVRVFESGGESYLELLNFGQHIRAKKSKYPDPPDSAEQLHSSCVADVKHLLPENEYENESEKAPTRKAKKTPIPANFGISESVIDWAKANGYGHLQSHLDCFRLKCAAHGYQYANWDKAFMNAIAADWAKVNGKPKPGQVVI
jgi:hypothetical protein